VAVGKQLHGSFIVVAHSLPLDLDADGCAGRK
jgi:hypothetical protein